ncbi:MAG: RNA polymerase sigma factor [Thermoflexibacteraceae bacterium]
MMVLTPYFTHTQVVQIETDLVVRCLAEDRIAQRQFYDKYCEAMYNVAYRILFDEDEAADALQEAFVAAFADLKTYRAESSLGSWLKTIVVRKALYKLRHRKHFEDYNKIGHEGECEWQDALTGEALENAIKKLPEGYRTVFTLIEIEGYAHKEVAELLKISEGTSKSQLFHAKKMLQNLLKDLRP